METMSPLADKKARRRFNKGLKARGVEAKACGKCFVVKGLTRYNAHRQGMQGRQSECRDCNTTYRVTNHSKIVDQKAAYYLTNANRVRRAVNHYRTSNPEAVRQRKAAHYTANRSAVRAKNVAWKQSNPERVRLHNAARRAQRVAATLAPFTHDELLASWAEDDLYGCAFCGGPFEEIEHLVPLSRGGEHSIANLVPSCIECNRGVGGKHARDPWEWLAERFPELAPLLLPDA
ncbi:HNH endonuclease [Streptomyces scopuliridis]